MTNDARVPHTPRTPPVYAPAKWEKEDVYAVKACAQGTATPEQQIRALQWIEWEAATTDDVEYRTDSRDHAFASGRRFVGLQVRKLREMDLSILSKVK